MANFRIDFDDSLIRERLRQLGNKTKDITPALKNIGEYMRMRTEENFKREQNPDGEAWAQLSPRTQAQKNKKKNSVNKILQDTGDLRSSIAYQVDSQSVTIGTNKVVSNKYSLGAIHQFGAPKRNIPARPFLGVSDVDAQEILLIVGDHISDIV